MVANIAGNMFGLYPNIYNNQIALNDLSGYDMYFPSGLCMDPMLSMNGSIFGGMSATPHMMPPMMPSMGIPFGGTGNYEDYYKQYEKYQDFMIDSNVRRQQKMREAELKLNSSQEGIQGRISILQDKIVRNEQQQIKQAYDNLVEGVRSMYGNGTEEELRNRTNRLYKDAVGKTVLEDIREHGRDSFTQGTIQSMTFGLFNKKTAEETVSELTGQPVGTEENAKKIAGNVVGGALIGGAVWGLTTPLLKFAKVASKSKTAWGMAIGAIAGAAAAICGWTRT